MHFPLGCADTENYQALFEKKAELTRQEFSEFSPPKLECFTSAPSHFRMRAEFKIWHEDGQAYYAMYQPGEYKKPVKISEYSIGSLLMCDAMPPLLAAINRSPTLKTKLFQAEFLTATTGECLITLIYHRPLNDDWLAEAKQLERELSCKVIGRSRRQKLVASQDFILERFSVAKKTYTYQQVETGFTQPNAGVCEKMLNWAVDACHLIGGDLVELYCGNGNFTLPLADTFSHVLATEVSKTSVNSARYNIEVNKKENIRVLRMSSEEFTAAMAGEREFRRLKDVDLASYNFSTIFVDPPRAGLDSATEKLVAKFDNILYISCNPETLKANLKALTQTHRIERFAFFDQFPYTDHRECGVLLTRP